MESILFKECMAALGGKVVVLSKDESEKIFKMFEQDIPMGWSRIDWNKIDIKASIESLDRLIPDLKKLVKHDLDTFVYVLWNDASLPVIQIDLNDVLEKFDYITAIGIETWFYNPYQKYIIEFYNIGEMTAGIFTDNIKQ